MAKAAEPTKSKFDRTMPQARDPAVAVQEEYDAAAKHRTLEALTLFIARHPDSPQAAKAQREIERLQATRL